MDENEKYQHDINKRTATAMQGLLATLRLTNERIDLLGQMADTHLAILKIIASEEEQPIDKDRLRASMETAVAEVAELQRLHDLVAPQCGADPDADPGEEFEQVRS